MGASRLWWKRFVENVSFEPGMKLIDSKVSRSHEFRRKTAAFSARDDATARRNIAVGE